MLKEFRDLIITGNVVEFAVAVIMAGAIGGVVNGFVNDIIMPIVGYFTGGVDFAEKKIILKEAIASSEGVVESAEVAIRYGNWINAIVNLLIVGFVMFMIIRAYNKTKKPVEVVAAGPSQEELLAEIRDLLKK